MERGCNRCRKRQRQALQALRPQSMRPHHAVFAPVSQQLLLVSLLFASAVVLVGAQTSSTSTTSPRPSTTSLDACIDTNPKLCGFLAAQGTCNSPAFSELATRCCQTCSNSTLNPPPPTWFVCGFPGDSDGTHCSREGLSNCFAVTTTPSSCVRLPASLGLGTRYLRLEHRGLNDVDLPHFQWSIHRDPACMTSYSLSQSLTGSSQLGSCTNVRFGGTTVLYLTIFRNCTRLPDGMWDCQGKDLPCFHWTRQSETRCSLPTDSFTCEWDASAASCVLAGTSSLCATYFPPGCGPAHCAFDTYLQQCNIAEPCSCTTTGMSGSTPVPTGCLRNHNEPGYEGVPICYLNGGVEHVASLCGCSANSDTYPGASFHACVPQDDCNVVHLESDEYPEVTGNYVAVEIDVNPNGCVPTTVFVADDFGFANSLVFFAAVADYGFSPENVAWRNLDKTWLLYEYVDYAIIFEGAALNGFITAEPVPLTKQVSDTSPSALTGVWDLRVGTGLRRPTDVSATCMSKFPCSRPFITPAPSSIDDNMDIPAKLQALQSTPRIAARAQRILYTTLHHHFTLSVLALHKPMLNAFYTASLPNTATRAFIPTIARITCEGASRANATISVPTVAVVLDMLEEIHAEGSFSLSLAPYATYLCTINTIGDTCIPATIEDKVLITPPLPPLAPVRGLEVTHVTRACVDVRWAPISPLEFRGPLLGYDVVITQGGVPISSVRVLQAHAHVCNLRVGQPYNVSVTADNGVGRTDPVSVPFYAASGVIEVRLNVTAERIDDIDDIDDSDDSVQLSWLPLSRQAGAGTIQRYHIAVFSARRLSDLRSLSLPHSTDPAELVTATPDRCTFEGLTIMSASSVHSTDPNAKVVVVLSGFAPHLAYAIAVAPENREHVGPFSSIATVDATISAASSGGSGLLLAETIAIVTIVLVIAVIGLVIVIVRHRAHRAGTKRTRIKLPSDIGAFTIRNSSSVLAVRLLFSDPFFDVFAGHMPKWNAEARCMVEQPITIKQLRDPQDRDHLDVLRNEVCALHALRNSDHRVIELIGVHIHKRLAFIVVSPKRCSLHRLLLDSRAIPGRPALIDLPQLVQLATQVIAGLSFVHERRIVHRALCAAHIFVHENGQLQIGGFSAAIVLPKPTKSSGGKRKPGRIDTEKLSEAVLSDLLQVRWMAPESIADCVFNFASDTYSLGVVLWELFTYGQQPWAGFSNAEVAQNVAKLGRTLARPQACPMQLYQVMKSCWDANPPDRPVLPALSEQLQQAINSSLLESLSSFKSTDGLHRGHESPLEQKPSRTSLFGNVEALDVTGLGIFGGDDDTAVADMSPNDRDQMMMVYMMGHKDDQDEDNWTNRTSSRPASPKANTRFSFV